MVGKAKMGLRFWMALAVILAVFIVIIGEPLVKTADFRWTVEREALYFPVGKDVLKGETLSFEDSFGERRSFGGERKHEGCDIMADNKERGYYPVFSVSDGVIENIGWLTLGGYRVGVRSTGGIYYYYAHLDSYAEGLKAGNKVKAGQLLGFMGDTGYGKEGTRGKFPVHLHFGIYTGKEEKGQNPYWILKRLVNKQIAFIPVSMVKYEKSGEQQEVKKENGNSVVEGDIRPLCTGG